MTTSIGPSAAIITIGDELVEGRIVNENAAWLVEQLMAHGILPRLVCVVPDDLELIVRSLSMAAESADVAVVSGGIGWTPDDITRRAVAIAFDRPLCVDERRALELSCDPVGPSPPSFGRHARFR